MNDLTQAILDDEWRVATNAAIEAQPDSEPDFMRPEDVGRLDAELGLEPQPLEYYVKLGDVAAYEQGYAEARLEMETGINPAAELADYADDVEERQWLGGWR